MRTVHDGPNAPQSAQTRPYPGQDGGPGWSGGPGGPGWPGDPAGPVPAGHPDARARRRAYRLLAVAAASALAVAVAGSAWALSRGDSKASALTTAQIVAKTDPAVVDVVSSLGYQGATSSGTGIVLTSSGEVLTNNHVVHGATSIKVRDDDNGHVYRASVVGYDGSHDVAVLQLRGASGLATADLGDSSQVATGDRVLAIGNAEGRDGSPSVASGTVTGLNQQITASDESAGTSEQLQGLIQTNAPIQPGDSGGPLVNSSGQVIGMDTAASSAGSQLSAATMVKAFSIPINQALSVASQIESGHGSATVHIGPTAFLGVGVTASGGQFGQLPGFSGGNGNAVQVTGVLPGSPAERAGLSAGDTITSVAGRSVSSPTAVHEALNQHHPGDKVSISWTDQAGSSHTATVTLAQGPVG